MKVITDTTHNICDECLEDKETTIELGETNYQGSATAIICIDCIIEAMTILAKTQMNHFIDSKV